LALLSPISSSSYSSGSGAESTQRPSVLADCPSLRDFEAVIDRREAEVVAASVHSGQNYVATTAFGSGRKSDLSRKDTDHILGPSATHPVPPSIRPHLPITSAVALKNDWGRLELFVLKL